jgi:CheY-like chemotaxis protein
VIVCRPQKVPVRLAQLLSNLDNAAKYSPDGAEISIEVALEGEQVCIGIRDTGIGIPKEQIDSIFDLFAQLDGSTTTSRGLGMGLALVRSLATLHEGSIDVASGRPGKGGLFTVRLPISPASSSSDTAKELAKQGLGSTVGRRILLVEDNFDLAESMAELLAMDGHIVNTAQDAASALDMLRKFEPDIVLLDVGLPGMDGYQVARRIRERTNRRNLVVITLSGYGEEEHCRLSIEAGCDDHLLKPLQPAAIRNLLRNVSGTR